MIVQRALAGKTYDHAKAGTVLCAFIKILPLFLLVFPGMISRILFPGMIFCFLCFISNTIHSMELHVFVWQPLFVYIQEVLKKIWVDFTVFYYKKHISFMHIFFWYGLKMHSMVALFTCNYMKLELNSFEDYL